MNFFHFLSLIQSRKLCITKEQHKFPSNNIVIFALFIQPMQLSISRMSNILCIYYVQTGLKEKKQLLSPVLWVRPLTLLRCSPWYIWLPPSSLLRSLHWETQRLKNTLSHHTVQMTDSMWHLLRCQVKWFEWYFNYLVRRTSDIIAPISVD